MEIEKLRAFPGALCCAVCALGGVDFLRIPLLLCSIPPSLIHSTLLLHSMFVRPKINGIHPLGLFFRVQKESNLGVKKLDIYFTFYKIYNDDDARYSVATIYIEPFLLEHGKSN